MRTVSFNGNPFRLKKMLLVLSILWVSGFSLNAQTRQVRNMDFNWKFYHGDPDNAQQPDFNDSNWRILDVPHDWSIEHEFTGDIPFGENIGYLPTGIGWYRKAFSVSRKDLKNVIRIVFDGVYMNSDVWINGKHLGHYPFGYNSFSYLIHPHVKEGENTIAVRVDNSQQPNSRWYAGSGIYRHVRMVVTNPLHIGEYGIYITTPEVNDQNSSVHVKTKVKNEHDSDYDASLYTVVADPAGNIVGSSESPFTIEAGNEMEIEQAINVEHPVLWSDEEPVLYTLKSHIRQKNKVLDDVSTPFGIRKLEFLADRGFLLNGKQVKFRGVNLHHIAGGVGAAVPEAVWEHHLKTLKTMGCNAIRTSHNPVAPEFLDMCDRMGFLVMNEAFDEWIIPKNSLGNKIEYGYHTLFEEWAEDDLTKMIHRDRNHPSVVMWSIGNEVREQATQEGIEICKMLVEVCHREDPTRPVTQGNNHIANERGYPATIEFLESLDIVGYNYVDLWPVRREMLFVVDKLAHPHWKMTGSENSAIYGERGKYSLGDNENKAIPDYNARMIAQETLWKAVASLPFVMGDFMWTGMDYLGEAAWPYIAPPTGAIDRCGFKKDSWYFYQSQWTSEPMVHIFPHWNWEGREGQILPVVCYTNCESVELFLNGKSYGEKRYQFPTIGKIAMGNWRNFKPNEFPTTEDLHLSWDVPYEPGVLKAVGKDGDKIVFTAEVTTTGMPAAIRLVPNKEQLDAGKRDVAHITVEIVDKEGNVVPTASNRIEFEVSGQGKLIGVDNGDLQDYDSFKADNRKAFHGLCMALVQTNGKAGEITFTAKSEGLSAATLKIEGSGGSRFKK